MSCLHKRKNLGFSLIELLVTMGIIVTILTVVTLNQSTYVESASLTNLADQVGSTIVQAQAYGIAVRELTPGSADFSASYGLSVSLLGSGSPTSYLFFADRNNNRAYDGDWSCLTGGLSECLEKTEIGRGNYVSGICIITSAGGDQCESARRADILFLRPDPEAVITFYSQGGEVLNASNKVGVKIKFQSPGGLIRSVSVYDNGQVSVQ